MNYGKIWAFKASASQPINVQVQVDDDDDVELICCWAIIRIPMLSELLKLERLTVIPSGKPFFTPLIILEVSILWVMSFIIATK